MELHCCYRGYEVRNIWIWECHFCIFRYVFIAYSLPSHSLLLDFRVLFRLALFKNSGYKMILEGGETTNNERHLETSTSQHRANAFTKHGGHHSGYLNEHNQWNLEGRALSALSRFGDNARMISPPAWSFQGQHQHAMLNPPGPYRYYQFVWLWSQVARVLLGMSTDNQLCLYSYDTWEANSFHYFVWTGSSRGSFCDWRSALHNKTAYLRSSNPQIWESIVDSLVSFSGCGPHWDKLFIICYLSIGKYKRPKIAPF